MMTKKMMCRKVIEEFKRDSADQYLKYKTDDELVQYIFGSTTLGIALETLGVITPEKYPDQFVYLSDRGGIFQTYYDKNENKCYFITFREFLSLLPDELEVSE